MGEKGESHGEELWDEFNANVHTDSVSGWIIINKNGC